MIAVKENREYTINEADAKAYAQQGYDVYDNKGNVVAWGAGKTISYAVHMDMLKAKDEEIAKLKKEIAKLKKG
jgi:hypothetical protein